MHLVILPGWEHGADSWRQFVDQFGAERATVVELPGFGKERLVDPRWGVPEYAEWAKQKIELLQKDGVVLLGHSFGGRVAAVIASERPAWLKGLILYGAPCLYRPRPVVKFKMAIARLVRILGLAPHLRKYFGNPDLIEADENGKGGIFRRVVSFDQTNALPSIAVPTLLVWGERDTEAPIAIGREMKDLIPRAALSILPGVGHNAHIETPHLFYGLVTRFTENL